MFAKMDPDGSGSVNFLEFKEWYFGDTPGHNAWSKVKRTYKDETAIGLLGNTQEARAARHQKNAAGMVDGLKRTMVKLSIHNARHGGL